MTRVIQIADAAGRRRVALVDEPRVRLLEGVDSVYALANAAMRTATPASVLAARHATGAPLDYEPIYAGRSTWRLLPPIDHPDEPARCLVSGTGLTHIGSARDRNAMHDERLDAANARSAPNAPDTSATPDTPDTPSVPSANAPSDSLRMFQEGLKGGRPAPGAIGVAPEWFYKGVGTMLRAHGEPLDVPAFAEGGGEEAEIAGVYVIDPGGCPTRVGLATGNEFSDHRFERKNYLNLAGSKLRASALGPELVLTPAFDSVRGEVWIERDGTRVWWRRIASGDAEMSHSLQNIEHHHFKFEAHRRPGDVHVHYFGAHSLSFGEGVTLGDGDVMAIHFEGFGRPLRNVVRVEAEAERLITVRPLG
jgi:hypothetical protein